MDDNTKLIVQVLLEKGMTKVVDKIDIASANKYLNVISYEIVEFPHRGILVLKDRMVSTVIHYPWSGKTTDEVKRIFSAVAVNRYFNENSQVIDMLIRYNYLRRTDKLEFTERALVQFSDHIQEIGGRFKKCRLCGFLGEEGELHNACQNMIGRK